MKKYILLYLLLFTLTFVCKAQVDTQFWFVAPDVVSIAQAHADRPVFFTIVTGSTAAAVTFSIPANNTFTPVTFNVLANSTRNYELTSIIEFVENRPFGQVNNTGFLITSTAPISLYYDVRGIGSFNADPNLNQLFPLNPEIFGLKGSKALGKTFFIPSQNSFSNAVSEARESIDIVATEDNTLVTFNLTSQAQRSPTEYQFNQDYTITLNRGQTFALKGTTGHSSFSFKGSRIQSDKPIAVTISDDSIDRGGSWDLIGDQLLPVEKWGTEYVVVRGLAGAGQDRVYIVAANDNTSVTSNGVVNIINRGQQFELNDISTTASVYITSTKPICVMHLTGHIGNNNNGIESNSSIIPPLSCGGSTSLSFTRNTPNDFSMYVLVKDIAKGGFSINGNAALLTASDFVAVGTSGWSFANKSFGTAQIAFAVNANGSHIISNSIGNFHLGISSAFRNAANNVVGSNCAYFSNVEQIAVDLGADRSICQGQSIILDGGIGNGSRIYRWSTLGNPTTQTISVNTSGTYSVTVTEGTCSATSQMTLTVNPIPTPSIITNFNATYCTTQPPIPIVVTPAGGILTINGVQNTTFNPAILGAGNYTIVYTLTQNGCTNTSTKNVQVNNCLVKDLFIPDLFSPNQDGKNDKFIIAGEIINDFRIKIFTRFGTLVYEGSFQDASVNGWDGTYNGVQQPAGVYMWQISGENISYKNKNTGYFSLIR